MNRQASHEILRSFGRSYTKRLGLLDLKPYHPDLNLLQSRIVFEIHHQGEVRANELAERLQIDKGYLSRSLADLARAQVIQVRKNSNDKRERLLRLSSKGERLFSKINDVSQRRSEAFTQSLKIPMANELISHLAAAELLMGEAPLEKSEIKLRSLRPGDLGWVIGRHGEIYAQEYGWNMEFEKLVGEIALGFASKHDTRKERAWIAQARGVRLGCIFLVNGGNKTAKLRILLVDPLARGMGLGTRLVRECVRFSRAAGYRKITLWTNSVLHSARKIYVAEGFRLVREEAHHSFGHDLVGQYWELGL